MNFQQNLLHTYDKKKNQISVNIRKKFNHLSITLDQLLKLCFKSSFILLESGKNTY